MLALITALGALALSGCESSARGPVAVRSDSGNLEVAICGTFEITRIEGRAFYRGEPDYLTFLDVEGALSTAEQTRFHLEDLPAGLSGTAEEPPLTDLASIYLIFEFDGDRFNALFETDFSNVPEDAWLHPSGRVSDLPCS